LHSACSDRPPRNPARATRECAARMSISAARNILDFFAGKLDPALVVNAAKASPSTHRLMQA
jgi:hypothetical protein